MISAASLILLSAFSETMVNSDTVYWRELGLKQRDLQTFERLKSMPGLVSPVIESDPILVLGVFAQTEKERSRFARLYLRRELDRAEREIAFFRAYGKVYDQEIGTAPLIDLSAFRSQRATSSKPSRLVAIISTNCAACDQVVDWAEMAIHRNRLVGVDLYFPLETDEAEVQIWAAAVSLDRELAAAGHLTLNVGLPSGAASSEDRYPQIFWRQGDELQPLSLSERLELVAQ